MAGLDPAITTFQPRLSIPVRYRAARDQPVPDEQHHQRADRGGDEAGSLIRAVVADGLAYPRREKCAGNAEHGSQDEAARIIQAKLEEADQLHESGKVVAARKIWYSVVELYANNQNVAPLVAKAQERLADVGSSERENVP